MHLYATSIKEDPSKYNCASCTPDKKNLRKCLLANREVSLKGPNLPTITGVTLDNAAEKLKGNIVTIGDRNYGLCPMPLFEKDVLELWRIYNVCNGLSRVLTPDAYYALPNRYVEAVGIINAELSRVAEFQRQQRERGK